LKAGLIDELTITIILVLLGEGIPLFDSIGKEIKLKMMEVNSASNGFVQVRYLIDNGIS
jgi:dihydrofolate reductase